MPDGDIKNVLSGLQNVISKLLVPMAKREGLVAVLPACQGRVFYF
jgi:hypothetical protein